MGTRSRTVIAAFVGAAALTALPAAGGAGSGSGFGNDGMRHLVADAILPLPGGDIVLGNLYEGRVHLSRLSEDGADRGALPASPVGCPRQCSRALLAVDRRGRILVGTGPTVVRLRPGGVLDGTFGVRGSSILPDAPAAALDVGADDAIVVAGPTRLSRLLPDGTPDPQFGPATLPEGFDVARRVLIQRDGSVVVGSRRKLVRYSAEGELDTSYVDGVATVPRLAVTSLAAQADGKVLAAGVLYAGDGEGARGAVLRLLEDGRPDPSFGRSGLSAPWQGQDGVEVVGEVGVQPGGGIVVGGTAFYGEKQTTWFVQRLRPDGTSTRGSRGMTSVVDPERGCWGDYMHSLAVQPDGKILTSGWTCDDGRMFRLRSDLVEDAGRDMTLTRVPNWIRPVPLTRRGSSWVATIKVAVDYPATVTATVRTPGQRRLPLLAGSAAGSSVLGRTARSVSVSARARRPVSIRVVVPAAAVRAGREYVFAVEAEDLRERWDVVHLSLIPR